MPGQRHELRIIEAEFLRHLVPLDEDDVPLTNLKHNP